jgi:hypothetical protein
MALDPQRTMLGTNGSVFYDGKWLTNITSVEAKVEIEKEDIKVMGSLWSGSKIKGLKGSGTMSGYKITSEWTDRIGVVIDTGRSFVTELIFKIEDKDAFGTMRVRLKGVTFDSVPLLKFEHGAIVEEELPFTFTGYELMDKIVAPE